jgi:homospermidine synthase
MIKNKNKGIFFAEDLPSEEILENCKDWLGNVIFDWMPYYPEKTTLDFFEKGNLRY